MYDAYVTAIKEDSDEEAEEGVEVKYDYDDANKTIKTTDTVKISKEKFDSSTDEEKEDMKAKNIMKDIEGEDGVKCELKNVTRAQLGLE